MKRWLLILLCPWLALADSMLLRPGDTVPDSAWLDQDGQAFRLSDLKGKAVAVTFIFTRCPLPDYCPRLSARFMEAQRALAGERSWHLLSLSFDPRHDTPAVLKAYAEAQGAALPRWTFATGEGGSVLAWGARFGLTVSVKDGLLDHNLRTVVIDADGRVQHVFEGNEWTAEQLVWEMRKATR